MLCVFPDVSGCMQWTCDRTNPKIFFSQKTSSGQRYVPEKILRRGCVPPPYAPPTRPDAPPTHPRRTPDAPPTHPRRGAYALPTRPLRAPFRVWMNGQRLDNTRTYCEASILVIIGQVPVPHTTSECMTCVFWCYVTPFGGPRIRSGHFYSIKKGRYMAFKVISAEISI